jgi:calcineurin-like phosphoesterase family protein
MKQRDDIDPRTTWILSDSHFGHSNIVGYCARPEDHEERMIAEWRATVPADGTVLHLGDLSYSNNARFRALQSKELTGARKLLIRGNHDRSRFSFYRQCGFSLVSDFWIAWEHDPEYRIEFSHYPDPSLAADCTSGFWRLHGHIHNNGYYDGRQFDEPRRLVPFLRNHINLSVEQIGYRPVNLNDLLRGAILGLVPDAPLR